MLFYFDNNTEVTALNAPKATGAHFEHFSSLVFVFFPDVAIHWNCHTAHN